MRPIEVHDVENWREHYGRTCQLWATRLDANFATAVVEVGEEPARLWLIYFAGCALALQRGTAMIDQTLASRRVKGRSDLPRPGATSPSEIAGLEKSNPDKQKAASHLWKAAP